MRTLILQHYLGEVADNVEAFAVVLCHYVEEEGICVIVEGLVVQEALCQEAEVLRVALKRDMERVNKHVLEKGGPEVHL